MQFKKTFSIKFEIGLLFAESESSILLSWNREGDRNHRILFNPSYSR